MYSYADNVCNQEVFQIWLPQFVQEAKYGKSVHSWWKKNALLNAVSLKNVLHFLQFSFPNMTFPPTLHFFCMFFGTGFDMLIVVRISNAVWVRAQCSLVCGFECF
jgi:hypothetical protein